MFWKHRSSALSVPGAERRELVLIQPLIRTFLIRRSRRPVSGCSYPYPNLDKQGNKGRIDDLLCMQQTSGSGCTDMSAGRSRNQRCDGRPAGFSLLFMEIQLDRVTSLGTQNAVANPKLITRNGRH